MKIKWLLFWNYYLILLIPKYASADSPYGSMDVYYNDKTIAWKRNCKTYFENWRAF